MPPSSRTRKYDKGVKVMAKWPKTNLYFNGLIIDYNETEYLIRFDDEEQSELAVKYNQVSVPFGRSSRSRSRGRSPSRKSPGRPKTPDHLRKKSPGRKPASSMAEKKQKPSTRTLSPETRPSRPKREIRPVEKFDSSQEIKSIVEENDSGIRNQASLTISSYEKVTTILDGKVNNIHVDAHSIVQSLQMKSNAKAFFTRTHYCLFVTLRAVPLAALIVVLPLIYTQFCTKSSCTVMKLPDIPYKSKHYFSPESFAISGAFLLGQLILALIPVGKLVQTRQGYLRTNGMLSVLVSMASIPLLMKYNQNVLFVYTSYRQIMVSLTVIGIVLAVLLYLKSFFAPKDAINPTGSSGYWLPDFVNGREISPTIMKFDIKLFLFRCSIVAWILLTIIIVIKDIDAHKGAYSPTLLMSASLQVFYAVDMMWFEDSFLTTYEYTRVGCGMITCVGYLTMPFVMAVYTRFLLNHRTELPWYCLVGVFLLNFIGYITIRGSNSQKHAYRMNPSNPALAHLESLPTSAGTRLLVSGWWGFVRHPNYLGDLLVQSSWALLCGVSYAVPWLVWGSSLVYLLGRIFIVEADCKKKYGLAWSSYTSRIKYRLIPKVF